jgi:peptidoglycan/xylan/chitin deacetylase (PgdA/CDA1 family)
MKITAQKNFLRNTVCLIDKLMTVAGFGNSGDVVICYHSISNNKDKYSISPSNFKSQIRLLSKKYDFVSLDNIFKKNLSTRPRIALTIDDGYRDILPLVPFLKEMNIPVTIFVLSDPNKANRNELNHYGKLLSVRDIKYLNSIGWTVGCHSSTHADFSDLKTKEIHKEIVKSKKILEQKIGKKINYFAYPKGIFTEQVVKAVKDTNYKAAFTVTQSSINKKTDRMFVPRIVVDKTVPNDYFQAYVSNIRLKIISALGVN